MVIFRGLKCLLISVRRPECVPLSTEKHEVFWGYVGGRQTGWKARPELVQPECTANTVRVSFLWPMPLDIVHPVVAEYLDLVQTWKEEALPTI